MLLQRAAPACPEHGPRWRLIRNAPCAATIIEQLSGVQLPASAPGLLLLVVGVMLLTGAFSAFSYWLLETFPGLATLG